MPKKTARHFNPVDREWTVEIVPHPFSEVVELADAAEQAHALIAAPAADECRNELQIIAPEAYTQNGTLPVYKAKARDFSKTINYAWFNHSGISKEQVSAGSTCGMVDFNDEGHLESSSGRKPKQRSFSWKNPPQLLARSSVLAEESLAENGQNLVDLS